MRVTKLRLAYALICSLVLTTQFSSLALANSGGLDTPSGVTSLPLQVEGNVAINITDSHDPLGAVITFDEPTNIKFPFTAGNTTIGTDGAITMDNAGSALTVAGWANLNGGVHINSNQVALVSGGLYLASAPGAANQVILNTSGLFLSDASGNNTIVTNSTTGEATFQGTVYAKHYSIGPTQAMTILGTVECLIPESNASVWMARNANGAATGCSGPIQATCSAGTPTLIMVGHDLTGAGELGGFCAGGTPANSCQTALFWCVD